MYCCEIDSLFLFCLFYFHNQLNLVRSSVRPTIVQCSSSSSSTANGVHALTSWYQPVVHVNSERLSHASGVEWVFVCVCFVVLCGIALWVCVRMDDGWVVFIAAAAVQGSISSPFRFVWEKNVVDGSVSCLPDWLHWLLIHEKWVVGTQRRKYVASLNKQWLHRRIRRRRHVNMCYEWNWGSGLGAWWSTIGW